MICCDCDQNENQWNPLAINTPNARVVVIRERKKKKLDEKVTGEENEAEVQEKEQ